MNIHENKLIRLSMITLLLSLLIVYILLYQIKWDKLKENDDTQTYTEDQWIVITTKSGDQTMVLEPLTDEELTDITWASSSDIYALESNSIQTTISPTLPTNNIQPTDIHMLSGTKLYYGNIDSIEKLGIKYQYALIDNQNIFYMNLWVANYDFDAIARALGWSLYKITTEQELAQNKLFWNKFIYINLPDYKDKLVLMLIYINDEVRLVQIDFTLYHKSKSYLKSLFIE